MREIYSIGSERNHFAIAPSLLFLRTFLLYLYWKSDCVTTAEIWQCIFLTLDFTLFFPSPIRGLVLDVSTALQEATAEAIQNFRRDNDAALEAVFFGWRCIFGSRHTDWQWPAHAHCTKSMSGLSCTRFAKKFWLRSLYMHPRHHATDTNWTKRW